MRSVNTKEDFVRRYMQGEFGNRSPTWNDLNEMEEDPRSLGMLQDESQLWHIRNRRAGGPTVYNVRGEDLADCFYSAVSDYPNDKFYISAMSPTELTLIQGEVHENPQLILTWTDVKLPMRDALATKSETAMGLAAWELMQRHMCPNSWEWLNYLLNTYPRHVIEFSVYGKEWGTVPHFNTVFWEVRNY